MKITRNIALALKDEIEKAVNEVTERHGLSASLSKTKFTSTMLGAELNVIPIVKDSDGKTLSLEALEFKKRASSFGLSENDLGRPMVHDNKIYRLVGYHAPAKKYNFECQDTMTGQIYRFSLASLKAGFERYASVEEETKRRQEQKEQDKVKLEVQNLLSKPDTPLETLPHNGW